MNKSGCLRFHYYYIQPANHTYQFGQKNKKREAPVWLKAQALEGIVLKRKDSRYEVGKRSHSWLKVVNYQYADVYVVGYRKAGEFGLLLTFDDGRYAGVMELGTNPLVRKHVYGKSVIREEKDFAFIEPIKCRVKYRNLTKAGKVRLPSFVEWI